MIDASTPRRGYPLPHEQNVAFEDAKRLKTALGRIDEDMQAALDREPPAASETAAGRVRLATAAEMTAGMDAHAVPAVARVAAFVAQRIADLVGTAPAALDTIVEIAEALKDNPAVIDALQAAIATKADASAVVNKAGGQILTGGFAAVSFDAGTKSSGTFTPDVALGNIQRVANGGAHALAPPAGDCSMWLRYTNVAGAGALTTAGFSLTTGSFSTAVGARHIVYIAKIDGDSHVHIAKVAG
ncbi:hypothetical protein CCR97_23405 [Rhodoplanes elegans]|uniref:Phage tail protein n=1 Tax=Rhodoplanes elegans TaxID=29408 RepID=A0A327KL12_9BRAD|nr:hypothetical protein [Rhodoplanes elegans]MBK5961129.1 hypothetical protein [Rhodoplanes elegans]RAI38155.1 hypothetical protein CH338_13635 [Rhodoplanes elegans]